MANSGLKIANRVEKEVYHKVFGHSSQLLLNMCLDSKRKVDDEGETGKKEKIMEIVAINVVASQPYQGLPTTIPWMVAYHHQDAHPPSPG